jgi:hypothetical protein
MAIHQNMMFESSNASNSWFWYTETEEGYYYLHEKNCSSLSEAFCTKDELEHFIAVKDSDDKEAFWNAYYAIFNGN